PLHYTVIMHPWLCVVLVLVSWIVSVLYSLLQSLMLLRLSFRTHTQIPHFFCEFNQVIHLACSDTFINDIFMYLGAIFLAGGPFTGIVYSYCKIVSSIRKISSAQGKYKAFSTCASHLSVVFLFYCTVLGVYLSSAATHSPHSSAAASVMYNVVTPIQGFSLHHQLSWEEFKSPHTVLSSRKLIEVSVKAQKLLQEKDRENGYHEYLPEVT
ncbi:olfactory receptor 7A10-like, partial [Tupaia chinensis]|uniref:olfactory receptor 7A10-like n=1 Tax=Tupaia chinensis TaxID=246437 RepID=UPI000FFBA6B7